MTNSLNEPEPLRFVVFEAGEYGIESLRTEVFRDHLAEHRAEIRSEREITTFVQLLRLQSRPATEHLLAIMHIAADYEQSGRVAVIGAAVAVLPSRAPEFRHRHDDDVRHPVAEIADESLDRLREVVETRCELACGAALVDVRIPAPNIRERDLETDVGLDQLRDLSEMLAEW